MRIAHIGPPVARRGGPAGYLWQLKAAFESAPDAARHTLTFPPTEPRVIVTPTPLVKRVRARLGRAKRAVFGAPPQYRPDAASLRRDRGLIDDMLTAAAQHACIESTTSLNGALHSRAEVLFVHEPAVAERVLAERGARQQVWMMLHTPMPVSLFLAWNWGVPESPWQDVAVLPDVQRWTEWELDICRRVDRLIIPCPEAVSELVRVDAAYGALGFDFVLTGATAPPAIFGGPQHELRARWRLPRDVPIGLFLGNSQPYRGLDALLASLSDVPANVPGMVAVAGPPKDSLPRHARVRALGPVSEVADLLSAVDFVINVNRFSLFDLSTIEAAHARRPLLLHSVGGNRRFAALGAGCEELDDLAPATIAAGLARMFSMTPERRAALGASSGDCYERHLKPEDLWARHTALYDVAVSGLLSRRP
jgi:glycosyltransferase involved in cell wall biosynthesis